MRNREYQINLETGWSVYNVSTEWREGPYPHQPYCLMARQETMLREMNIAGSTSCISCGGAVCEYSPRCKTEFHRPSLPDEVTADSIIEYKIARLEYMKNYLDNWYSSSSVSEWMSDLHHDIVRKIKISHTYMFDLPVLAKTQGKPVEGDSYIRCYICNEMVSSINIQDHREDHSKEKKARLMKMLGMDSEFELLCEKVIVDILRDRGPLSTRQIGFALQLGSGITRDVISRMKEQGILKVDPQAYTEIVRLK